MSVSWTLGDVHGSREWQEQQGGSRTGTERRKSGVWLQLPPRGTRFLKVGGCPGSGSSVAGGMVDPRGHTGQGTVTRGCPGLGVGVGGRARAKLVPSAPEAPREQCPGTCFGHLSPAPPH